MARHDAGAAVRRVIDNIEPGESEIKIAEKLRHNLAVGGMTSVVTLVAADERISQYRHPVPTAKRWNNTLLLVTCAKRGGLIASLSRMVCIGEVPDELKIRTEAAAFINARLMHATRPGVTGAVLYQVAANAYAEKGFADEIKRHHQGGAAGYRTRDWVAHPTSGEVVQENQAFAWNPSITGTKVEETCILTANGIEVLTESPDFPSITTVIDGQTYSSHGVLSI
ncbi:MAG: M24 family metallopeptidase [Saprospiraceae bacterium]|nr:M24 family metallopeptidase [Saprospiraceae bacterium]